MMNSRIITVTIILTFNLINIVSAVQTIRVGDNEGCTTLKAAYDSIRWNPADSTVSDETHIILTSNIRSIELPMSGEYTRTANNEHDFYWVKRGTAAKPILIYSEQGNKYAINRPDENSKKSAWAFIFYRVDYLTINSVIFNGYASGIFLSACNYCTIENCEFYAQDFQVKTGGGMIELSGPAYIPGEKDKSKFNTIRNNLFEFRQESFLDISWEDEDIWNPNWRWNRYDAYHAIYLAHCHGNIITGNTFINAPGFGVHAWGDYTSGNKISQNTFKVVYGHDYKLRSPLLDKTYADSGLKSDPKEWYIDAWRHGVGLWFRSDPATVKDNIITDNDFYTNTFSPLINYCVSDGTFNIPQPSNILAMPAALLPYNNQLSGNRYHENWQPEFRPSNEQEYLKRYEKRYKAGEILMLEVPFDSAHFLIVDKFRSVIYKVKRGNWQNQSMFANYYLGYQKFKNKLTTVEFAETDILLGFRNGHFLKITGTGGTGPQMFNISEKSDSGFEPYNEDNPAYLSGYHKFRSAVRYIKYIYGYSFICFDDGKILKIKNTGGDGENLFKISESAAGFSSLAGFNYYSGHHKFSGRITNITNIKYDSDYLTYFCFDNGKILQIAENSGTGGTGENMFAITENQQGFASLPGHTYYRGDDKFDGIVTKIYYESPLTIFCFKNLRGKFRGGKILAVSGTGNGGENMFATDDDSLGFTKTKRGHYFGHELYRSYVTDIVRFNDHIFISFSDGKLKKFQNTGKRGAELLDQVKDGYEKFFSTVTDLQVIDDNLLICLMNGKILKIGILNGKAGDDRAEMFNIFEGKNYFKPCFSKNRYLLGSDYLYVAPYSNLNPGL